jgi:thiol-disulfide isomerase/thioredoxin
MRILCLLVLTCLLATPCFSQSYHFNNGDTWYYKVISTAEYSFFNVHEEATYKITVTSKQKTGNYLLDIMLLDFKEKSRQREDSIVFDAANLRALNFNNTGIFKHFLLLQQTLRVTMNRDGKILEIRGGDSLLAKAAKEWRLEADMQDDLIQYNKVIVPTIINNLFPTLPLQQTTGFTWKKDSTVYVVTAVAPGAIQVYGTVTDNGHATFANGPNGEERPYISSTEENYSVGMDTSMLLHYQRRMVMRTDTSQEKGRTPDSICTTMEITGQLQPLPAPVLDRDYMNMLVNFSFWSDSLKGSDGKEKDSAKVMHFIAVNDQKYAGDSTYRIKKLDLINGMDGDVFMKMYYQMLVNTPIRDITKSTHHLHNKLQRVQHENADTALALMKQMHINGTLSSWVHNSFAQEFEHENRPMANEILQLAVNDSDTGLLTVFRPLQLWRMAQQANGDKAKLKVVAANFNRLGKEELWYGRAGRYAMLIYEQLQKAGMPMEAGKLLDDEIDILKADQGDTVMQRMMGKQMRDTKAVHKQLMAHAYKLKYEQTLPKGKKAALPYLIQAAAYAPQSRAEKAYDSHYDRYMLHAQEDYREELATVLANYGNPEEALQVMTTQLKTDPLRITDVQAFFQQHFPNKSFSSYFKQVVIKGWNTAPDFVLKDLQDKQVRLADYKGKWLLLDFWGTWCSPCRAEMPEVNALAKEIAEGKYPNTALLSIACNDNLKSVQQFMSAHQYEIPAVISDNRVQGNYKIRGYPSKVLISPEGKMVPIDYGMDYKAVLKSMVSISDDLVVPAKVLDTQVKSTIE